MRKIIIIFLTFLVQIHLLANENDTVKLKLFSLLYPKIKTSSIYDKKLNKKISVKDTFYQESYSINFYINNIENTDYKNCYSKYLAKILKILDTISFKNDNISITPFAFLSTFSLDKNGNISWKSDKIDPLYSDEEIYKIAKFFI